MKKIILKILLLIVLVTAVNKLVRSFVPTYWYDSISYTKHHFYQDNKDNFKTVFLGSSRTRSGINPLHFDNKLNEILKPKTDNKSYNYAVAASTCGEIFYLADQILNKPSLNLEYLVIELRSSAQSVAAEANTKNIHTDRRRSWLSIKNYMVAILQLSSLKTSYLSFTDKLKYFYNYTIAFTQNTFNAGMFIKFIKLGFSKPYTPSQLGMHKNGFKALDNTKNKENRKKHAKFLKSGQAKIDLRKQASIDAFDGPIGYDFPTNSYYTTRINKLIKKGKDKSIHVVFVVPPLLAGEAYFKEIRAISEKIPNKHKIVLVNGKKYPKFYNMNNLWDEGHLNNKGSKIYSKLVAKKMAQIIQK